METTNKLLEQLIQSIVNQIIHLQTQTQQRKKKAAELISEIAQKNEAKISRAKYTRSEQKTTQSMTHIITI